MVFRAVLLPVLPLILAMMVFGAAARTSPPDAASTAAARGLTAGFGPGGIASLKWNGRELLGDGTLQVTSVVRERLDGAPVSAAAPEGGQLRFDTTRRQAVRTFSWAALFARTGSPPATG